MPRTAKKKTYTQAQKLAYYKRMAKGSYRGRGEYTAPKSAAVGKQMGETIGSAAGFLPGVGKLIAPVASNLVGKLGSYLGNKLGTLAGWGDYYVKTNSLAVPEGNSPASMHNAGMTTRVSHREYIGDIISSEVAGTFKIESYPLQPGSNLIFPWLSSVALNYQKYRLRGALIEFKSGSGDALNSVNTSLGEVIISTNYNNADSNFTSRSQMENTQYCSSAKPSVSFVHIIECDPDLQSQESLYVNQSTEAPDGMTPNEINWCNVQVATTGVQGTEVNLGSLYITYDIELIQPVELGNQRHPRGDWFYSDNVNDLTQQAFSDTVTMGLLTQPSIHNSLGGRIWNESTYAFPENLDSGLFLIEAHYVTAGSGVAILYPGVVTTNCVAQGVLINGKASTLQSPAPSVVSRRAHMCICIRITGRGARVQLSPTGTLPSFTSGLAQYMTLMVNNVDANFQDLTMFHQRHQEEVHVYNSEGTEEIVPHTMSEFRKEYEMERLKSHIECTDEGDSETIYRMRQRLKELEGRK